MQASRGKSSLPADLGMATQLARTCTDGNDIGARSYDVVAALQNRPVFYANVCIRASLIAAAPERKATFLLEGVRSLSTMKLKMWHIDLMLECLEKTDGFLKQKFADEKRYNTLCKRRSELAVKVFHAAGYFHACANEYEALARASANGTPTVLSREYQFMAALERFNAAVVQSIPQNVVRAATDIKISAGHIISGIAPLSSAYWETMCLIHTLRADWLAGMPNPESRACLKELDQLRRHIPEDHHGALEVLTAAYDTQTDGSMDNPAITAVQKAAQNPHVHPDWRAEAYLALAFAKFRCGFKETGIAHLESISALPPSGGHVARAIAYWKLRLLLPTP